MKTSSATQDKVEFLRRADVYPEPTREVVMKETHMSWVFLTDRCAYKLKKPVRYEFLDYSSLQARHHMCAEELRLNRRLAPEVYLGLVPLTLNSHRELELDGRGETVDWLVKMRRLRDEQMLDHVIAAGAVPDGDTRRVGETLAAFYETAVTFSVSQREYRDSLSAELCSNRNELSQRRYLLPVDSINRMTEAMLNFIDRNTAAFDYRVEAGKIKECHGDLRPEHICLERPPVIIDCLEFNPSLRQLDAASELAFLWLECARLGAPEVGERIFTGYSDASGDRPSADLMRFYQCWHAGVRAKIAVWHVNDHEIDHPSKWIEKARNYIRHAERLM